MNKISPLVQFRPFSRSVRTPKAQRRRAKNFSSDFVVTKEVAEEMLHEMNIQNDKDKNTEKHTRNTASFLVIPRTCDFRIKREPTKSLLNPKYSLIHKRTPYSAHATSLTPRINAKLVQSPRDTASEFRSVSKKPSSKKHKRITSLFPIQDSVLAVAYAKTNPGASIFGIKGII